VADGAEGVEDGDGVVDPAGAGRLGCWYAAPLAPAEPAEHPVVTRTDSDAIRRRGDLLRESCKIIGSYTSALLVARGNQPKTPDSIFRLALGQFSTAVTGHTTEFQLPLAIPLGVWICASSPFTGKEGLCHLHSLRFVPASAMVGGALRYDRVPRRRGFNKWGLHLAGQPGRILRVCEFTLVDLSEWVGSEAGDIPAAGGGWQRFASFSKQ
jgi:hypothetical protein